MRKLPLSSINPTAPPAAQLTQIRDTLSRVAAASNVQDGAWETIFTSTDGLLAAGNVQAALDELASRADDFEALDGAMT